MNLTLIQSLYEEDKIYWATHAVQRMNEREISISDVEHCILHGEIIEEYPDDYPHPSCLIYGTDCNNNILHTVVGCDNRVIYIITSYRPSADKFMSDLRTRKEP